MARSASDTFEGADVDSVKVQHLGSDLTMSRVSCCAVARIQRTCPTPAPMPPLRTPGSLTEADEEWVKANLDLCAPLEGRIEPKPRVELLRISAHLVTLALCILMVHLVLT